MTLQTSLTPTYFIDSGSRPIFERVRSIVDPGESDVDKAVKLFYAVRDGLPYNPYRMTFDRDTYPASFVLGQGDGFCIQKAIVLAAMSRAAGVPCRLRFATVRNHLVTKRLKEAMKSDVFVFHGYNEFHLGGRWIKATPTFNLSLCEKFGVHPLEFNGRDDSILHPFDRQGNKHMEYLYDYGSFDDFPFEMMVDEFSKHYPHVAALLAKAAAEKGGTDDFEREAVEENKG
jgi:transglutaminase-like putative cysteine protease